MLTNHQIIDMIEERFLGWSWQPRIQALTLALSRFSDLLKDMEEQFQLLSSLLIKAEMFGVLSQALHKMTTHERKLEVSFVQGEAHCDAVTISGDNINVGGASITTIIEELKKLEQDFSHPQLKLGNILRFLQKELRH